MNFEYTEAVFDVKPEKAKEVIKKSHTILKNCIVELRNTVSLLKENSEPKELHKSLDEIFKNFQGTDNIKFHLGIEENIEKLEPYIKSCIYKTVREAVTNGVKHGKATEFIIDIFNKSGIINITIKNNGLECTDIVKSHGLKGIEERIEKLAGSVTFYSEKDYGFVVEARIPEISSSYDKI